MAFPLTWLYADDTVIFATDPATFQENIKAFFEYSERWRLNINLNRTKSLYLVSEIQWILSLS